MNVGHSNPKARLYYTDSCAKYTIKSDFFQKDTILSRLEKLEEENKELKRLLYRIGTRINNIIAEKQLANVNSNNERCIREN